MKIVSIKFAFFAFLFFCCLQHVVAQEEHGQSNTSEAHGMKGTHRIGFGLGHTQISEGKFEGRTQWVPLASWSLNYDYWISDHWAVGLQNDWILETFVIEDQHGTEIERKNPIAVIPVALYKFAPRWTALAGVGAEFSKSHNFTTTRLGIEYGAHLPKNWEFGVALVWDNKWNYYNSWGIAFVMSKLVKKKSH